MKKNKLTFEKKARYCFLAVLSIYIVGGLMFRSMESSLNVQSQKIEAEIQALQYDIDGLDIEKQNLTAFARLNDVATSQGYTYSHSNVTAYVSGK